MLKEFRTNRSAPPPASFLLEGIWVHNFPHGWLWLANHLMQSNWKDWVLQEMLC